MNAKKVYIKKTNFSYCENPPFHPGQKYPEHPDFFEMDKTNILYGDFRDHLNEMGLDSENFNTSNWNPFKSLITQGQKVLLKPNMVMHINRAKSGAFEALVTHGSIIRMVVDYVYIALKGTGKIYIGDAPLQACDFEEYLKKSGVKKIADYYKSCFDFQIQILDFRQERAILKGNSMSEIIPLAGDPSGYEAVDLGNDSLFANINGFFEKYRVTNYMPELMKEHHNKYKNEYLIPKSVLECDVFINLPKPKTHRKGGMTGALKNLIGINGHKDWLPHHRIGPKKDNGDEYLKSSILKEYFTFFQEKFDIATIQNLRSKRQCYKFIKRIFHFILINFVKEKYREGSWWGNDTIWRTILDLNRLLFYADKNGVFQPEKQRKYFVICDMIVSGEAEGPVEPDPKKVGMFVSGSSSINIDTVIATLMGFDIQKIPQIYQAYKIKKFPIVDSNGELPEIYENGEIAELQIQNYNWENSLKFIPTKGWQGYIELK